MEVPVAHTTCKAWFMFQSLCTISLMSSVNALLMLRVYALYDRSRRVATFLVTILFMDVVSLSAQALYLCAETVVVPEVPIFDEACLMKQTPSAVLSSSIEVLVIQGTLWGMTWWKSNRSEPWTRTPLISLVVRDGAFVFVGLFAILVITLPYALLVRSVEHVVFSWSISLMAFIACRLIINLLQLNTSGAGTQGDLELTSFIEIPLTD
ncbi:hypothetical protein BD779DRAFT_1025887 [Infundibulicybe gibba]|nr:hypothetical protein BD779DRAFT_1025887 [Infundibulicybe gibba]